MAGNRGKGKEKEKGTKRVNVKEMLAKNRKEKEEQERRRIKQITLPQQLMSVTDTSVEVYKVSMFARVWFRENSNVNEVLDKYIIRRKIENPCKNSYLNTVIRSVMKAKHVRFFPFNTFQFNSIESHLTAKLLLKYPKIATVEDLVEVNNFFTQERIHHCAISMEANNPLYTDIKEIIDKAREDFGAENLRGNQNNALPKALRKHYKRTKTAININLQTTTVQELNAISNFDEIVLEEAKKCDIDENLDVFADAVLSQFQNNPAFRISKEKFVVLPKYNLLGNYITPEQERIISKDCTKFYYKTNAFDVLRPLKDEFGKDIDLSINPKLRKQKIRKKFFMLYAKQRHRNMPPFENLYWKDNDEEEEEEADEMEPLVVDEPSSPIQQSPLITAAYVQRKVFERNEETSNDENSKDSTVVELIAVSSTSTANKTPDEVIVPVEVTKRMALVDFKRKIVGTTTDQMEFIKIVSSCQAFMIGLNNHVKKELPDNVEEIFQMENNARRRSLMNFILFHLVNAPNVLRDIINQNCPEEVKKNALEKLDFLLFPELQGNY